MTIDKVKVESYRRALYKWLDAVEETVRDNGLICEHTESRFDNPPSLITHNPFGHPIDDVAAKDWVSFVDSCIDGYRVEHRCQSKSVLNRWGLIYMHCHVYLSWIVEDGKVCIVNDDCLQMLPPTYTFVGNFREYGTWLLRDGILPIPSRSMIRSAE